MKRNRLAGIFSKTLCLILLGLFSFHFSGAETAFCMDEASDSAPVSPGSKAANAHGCMNCQSGHHIADEASSASLPMPEPSIFSSDSNKNFVAQAPLSHPFRPPITA